jgi:adenine C2-methylase RlmN of 23S rRNA A2503 and tRNA A37
MARGEPLSPETAVLKHWGDLGDALARRAQQHGWRPRFLISSIFPKSLAATSLVERFQVQHPEFYYSLYSMNHEWRQRWMPRAMRPDVALDMLKEWQEATNKIPKIHYAFIDGENDSAEDVSMVCRELRNRRLRANFNIVRYNPPDESSAESRNLDDCVWLLKSLTESTDTRVDVVQRVGFDVKASCGMFVDATGAL